jgi:NHL repeat
MLARVNHFRWIVTVLTVLSCALSACGGGHSGIAPPSIATQPANASVTDGQSGSFTVTAGGSAPFSYQWHRNGVAIAGATSATYTIPAVSYARDTGAQFNVFVTNNASTVSSGEATLTVIPVAPTMTSAPQSQTLTAGATASFSATASGTTPLTYQWNKNGVPIPDGIDSTFYDLDVALADDGAQFTLTVTNIAGSVTSNLATLNVQLAPPSIVTQPHSQMVFTGSPATFVVVAGGSGLLHFQWRRNGAPIAGATSAIYVTPATSLADTGTNFDVVVTNSAGTVTSAGAVLTVASINVPPSIVTDPQNVAAKVGDSATFSVAAAGTQPLAYQWQRNGVNIAGATNSSFTLSPLALVDDQAHFAVIVSNIAGSAPSQSALLTVTAVPTGGIDLIAGQLGGAGNLDGLGGAARFFGPEAVTLDAAGTVFVVDTNSSTIRSISPLGLVKTVAGAKPGYIDGVGASAQFNYPQGIAADGAGNLYVADTANQLIRKISSTGAVTTLAGTVGVGGAVDGTGTAAKFAYPQGLATDSAGNIYVADSGAATIRKVTPVGVVTTLAGSPGVTGTADGTGAAARFNHPDAVVVDATGNVFVADTENDTIRMVTPAGVVTTLAGTAGTAGWVDGTGAAAQFDHPHSLAVDSNDNVFVADTFSNSIRMVTPAGVVTTIAGHAYTTGFADDNGMAALFSNPWGIAIDNAGTLYVSDFSNDTVRKIDVAATVTTLAGNAPHPGAADGSGSSAQFDAPQAAAADSAGNIYVADSGNSIIRKITPAGVVTTLAGTAGASGATDGTGAAAQFDEPEGVAVDATGNIYVVDTGNSTVRKITPAGVVTTLAGTAGATGTADGIAGAARFNGPQGIAVNSLGTVYVTDTGNNTLRAITSAGVVTTLAGTAAAGATDGTGAAAQFRGPRGITVDTAGNVYVVDSGNFTIREVTAAGVVTTLAGSAGFAGNANGIGAGARFSTPTGIAIDAGGNLYVMDSLYRIVRKIAAGGVVSTVAGVPGAHGVRLGALPGSFNNPVGIAVLPGMATTTLVVPDEGENAVLRLALP